VRRSTLPDFKSILLSKPKWVGYNSFLTLHHREKRKMLKEKKPKKLGTL